MEEEKKVSSIHLNVPFASMNGLLVVAQHVQPRVVLGTLGIRAGKVGVWRCAVVHGRVSLETRREDKGFRAVRAGVGAHV